MLVELRSALGGARQKPEEEEVILASGGAHLGRGQEAVVSRG